MFIALERRSLSLCGREARSVNEVNHCEQKTTQSKMKQIKNQKTIVKPVAAPVAARPETRTPKPAPAVRLETIIEARINVGFGNNLFVRGQGAGLSWEHGTPLTCVEPGTWRWSAPAYEKLTCKLLLNDRVWAQGEDVTVTPGKRVAVVPAF
jgi:hypothetical protein